MLSTATCTGAGETWSARGEASPLTVPGLANGHTYACTVSASNAAGMGAPSGAVKVTVSHRYPLADAAVAHRDLQGRRTVGSVVLVP